MTNVAELITDLLNAGVSAELVGRVAAAIVDRTPVVVVDQQADRRREKDRERARIRRNPQTSDDAVVAENPQKSADSPQTIAPLAHVRDNLLDLSPDGTECSEAKASAAGASEKVVPITTGADREKARAWALAVQVLTRQGGMKEGAARSFFGKLLGDHSLQAANMIGALEACEYSASQDPRAYLTKAAIKWAAADAKCEAAIRSVL